VNWITDTLRPRIKNLLSRRETEENLWVKCPQSGQMVFIKELEANHMVVPGSGYHMRMGAAKRLAHTFDNGKYEEIALPEAPLDPLKFRDEKRYADRLKEARTKTGMPDALKIGVGLVGGALTTIAAQDMDFMGGSLGTAAGEAIVKGMMTAVERSTPFIIFTASGGARMQEGILSLMQMPRTTLANPVLGPGQADHHRANGNPHLLGDLAITELLEKKQDQRSSVPLGHLVQQPLQQFDIRSIVPLPR